MRPPARLPSRNPLPAPLFPSPLPANTLLTAVCPPVHVRPPAQTDCSSTTSLTPPRRRGPPPSLPARTAAHSRPPRTTPAPTARAAAAGRLARHPPPPAPTPTPTPQENFVTDFVIGLGLDNAAQCADLVKELGKLALLFLVLEKLGLVAAPTWFERWIDHLSIESTLLRRQRAVLWERARAFLQFHRRIENC